MEWYAYGGALLLAYVVWWVWRGRTANRVPRLPELTYNKELTPIDSLTIRSAKERRTL